ncbi:MAG: glycosyltransferase family 4 protein [Actinomycetota bacterium]|nr:glycosyltransferase family 4 protein [Actinomycetota bacterium]
MKILLLHNRYRSATPGGEDHVVDQESATLAARGHTVERFERSNDEINDGSLLGKALLPGQVVWSEKTRRSLSAHLQRFCPDVVHVHNTFPLFSPSVLYACRKHLVPVVATLHHYRLLCPSGDLFRDGQVCHECVGRIPLPAVRHGCYHDSRLSTVPLVASSITHATAWRELVSAYIFLSRAQREIFAPMGLPPGRMFVKPNFVPEPQPIIPSRESMVAFIGRLTKAKGIDILMQAWDLFTDRERRNTLRLTVVGAGPLQRQVETWASRRPSVQWLGPLSRPQCSAVMARARAVIVPSRWEETFGLVAVEAMGAGVPPVASTRGSFPELITARSDGVLFDPEDPRALATVLEDIADNPSQYEAYGRRARRTYERRFRSESNIDQLLAIYDFAIRNPRHSTKASTGSH